MGLTKDQAIAALTAQDVLLNTNIETVQTNERPAGTVLSQSSAAGTLVAQNSTVTIRVAATPTQTTAPTTAATQPAAATGNQNATTGNQNQSAFYRFRLLRHRLASATAGYPYDSGY